MLFVLLQCEASVLNADKRRKTVLCVHAILRTLSHIPHSLDSSIIVYQLIKSQDNYVYGPITITVFTNTLIRSLVVDFSALSLFRVIA